MPNAENDRSLFRTAIFEGSCCTELSYSIKLRKGEFHTEEFEKATGTKLDRGKGVTCAPKWTEADYHLHVQWRPSKKTETLTIEIDFVKGRVPPAQDEKEPFAEEFISWLTQFVVSSKQLAHVLAFFEYPANARSLSFPLPMSTVLGPDSEEVQIDGITFSFVSPREGVERIWVNLTNKCLVVNLAGDQTIEFDSFDPRKDIAILSNVANSVLEERKS